MKKRLRLQARSKIEYTMALAIAEPDIILARRYAALAWLISTKHRVRMPPGLRALFCRQCKLFIPPGRGARIRVWGGMVRTTCMYCGHTHRRPMGRRRVQAE